MKFKILLVSSFFFLGLLFLFWEINKPLFPSKEFFSFDVVSGTSVSEISHSLQEKGGVVSPFFFRLVWTLKGWPIVKAGHYELTGDISLWKIFRVLEEGQVHLVRVTLPEGITLKGVASRLKEVGIIRNAEKFLHLAQDNKELSSLGLNFFPSAEGFLFPDTYLFNQMSSEREVLHHLVKSFWRVLEDLFPEIVTWEKEKVYEKIKLASIIEKEYRLEEEAPLIASVFDNRLRHGMRLESCATLIYIITEIQGRSHPNRIFWRDTEIENPYNTYINKGLPPTPIGNPGRIALSAALNPAKTDCFFFVVKNPKEGTHIFTGNFGDHSKARRDYLVNFVVK